MYMCTLISAQEDNVISIISQKVLRNVTEFWLISRIVDFFVLSLFTVNFTGLLFLERNVLVL